jgi:transglutaminase-like putative cysteine protease
MAALRHLLVGLWLTALFWPYTHAGAFHAPWALPFLPLFLMTTDLLPARWARRVAVGIGLGAVGAMWFTALRPEPPTMGALMQQLAQSRALQADTAGFLLLVAASLLAWFIYREAWTRDRILLLLLLGTAVLAANAAFWHAGIAGAVRLYLFIGLVLLAAVHFDDQAAAATEPPPAGWYVGPALLVVLPLLIGWTLPVGPSSRLDGLIGPGGGTPPGSFATGLPIGSTNINHAVSPSPATVFTVANLPGPAYWQASVYTHFDGTTWTTPVGPARSAPDGRVAAWLPADVTGFPTVLWHPRLTVVDPGLASAVLYTGRPLAVNGAGPLTVLPAAREILAPRPIRYQETLAVPEVNAEKLLAVPFTVPPPALGPDLAVPASLSPAVRVLAERITSGTDGPWQAALALKAYLDRHERYTFAFQPNRRRDPVDQFLFVTHAGYCDQFSTAFIMMARLLGIPARWVVGYSPGTYDPRTRTAVISGFDAHSWAQVFVPPYGWMAIDPTPGAAGTPGGGASSVVPPAGSGQGTGSHTVTPPASPPPTHRHPARRSHPAGRPNPAVLVWAGLAVVVIGGAVLTRRRPSRPIRSGRSPASYRLYRAWQALGRAYGLDFSGPARSLRAQWTRLPDAARQASAPAVRALEAWWYGGAEPTPEQLDALIAALRAAWPPRRGAG